MSLSNLTTLNEIFVASPGDFLFFLVVMILNLISLLMSLRLTTSETNAHQRYTIALGGIVFAWSLMFAGVVFIRVTGQQPETILPPLERAVIAATLLLFGWAFLTADHARWRRESNTLVLLLLLAVAVAYAITGIVWIDLSGNEFGFNYGIMGLSWIYALLALPVFGLLFTVMLFRDVIDAPIKIVYFLVIGLGGAGTITVMQQGIFGNDPGIYRLMFTLAQVMVPILVYRVVINQYEQALEDQSIRGTTPVPPIPVPASVRSEPVQAKLTHGDAINTQLLKAMGMILETGNPEDIPAHIVGTLLDVLRADVGALIRLDNYDFADISVAQDRMMGKNIVSKSISLDRQPTLVNAIERRAQRGLYPDRNAAELDDLYERMYIEQRGPAYFQPLTHNREVFAIILIAMPYTKKELKADEVELLKGIGVIAGSLLAVSYAAKEAARYAEDRTIQAIAEGIAPSALQQTDVRQARENLHLDLTNARQQVQNLTGQVNQLNMQLQQERDRVLSLLGDSDEDLSISQRITAITDEQIKLREERDELTRRYTEARAAMDSTSETYDDAGIKNLVETLRREIEILEAEKMRLETSLVEMQNQETKASPDLQRLINRMMAEKNALKEDRDRLDERLERVRSQLQSLDLEEEVTGMSQLIATLGDERKSLRQQNELLQQERDALLRERETVSSKIKNEKERDQQIEVLRIQIEKLAADREVAVRQHNKAIQTLNTVKEHRARLVAETGGYEIELNEVREEQEKLRAQVQELADERNQLLREHDRLVAENTATTAELERALARSGDNTVREQADNQQEIQALQTRMTEIAEERDTLDRNLRRAELRITDLETQLEVQQVATMAANGSADLYYEPNEPELLVGLVQELRTPLTTISWNVELLLNESAGILGEMQRKFLNSVGANISRLESMVDSLIHVTRLDTGNYRLDPRPIDFVQMVEQVITDASVQFRQKGLAVTIDLDDGIPPLQADEDSLREAVGQLLTNAYLISPPDGDIHVTVVRRDISFTDNRPSTPAVYVAIEDSGGGISLDDVPRVFARKYKAENPLIQGLGDTGVGMSIARAMVEAHDGKLWVETKEGIGSIFSFAIPLDVEAIEKRD